MEPVTIKEYVPWQTPRHNDERVQAIRERLAARRGVPVPMVSAMPQCCTPMSFISRTRCSTSSGDTSPW